MVMSCLCSRLTLTVCHQVQTHQSPRQTSVRSAANTKYEPKTEEKNRKWKSKIFHLKINHEKSLWIRNVFRNCCHKRSMLQKIRIIFSSIKWIQPAEKIYWTNQDTYTKLKATLKIRIMLCTLTLNRFHIYIIAENVKLYTSRRSTEAQNIKAMFIYHFSRNPLIKGFCEPPDISPL